MIVIAKTPVYPKPESMGVYFRPKTEPTLLGVAELILLLTQLLPLLTQLGILILSLQLPRLLPPLQVLMPVLLFLLFLDPNFTLPSMIM